MNDRPISAGDRIQVKREYGKVALVTTHGLWYHADDGRYRYTQTAERVHGLKHKVKV